jgi:primosomal protein N' (replication factor Y)
VLVQTYHPDHYAVKFAAQHDYPGFVAKEMQFRRSLHYPPFAVLANVILVSEKMEESSAWAAEIGRYFQRVKPTGVRVLGPAAAPIVRLKRIYRFHFVLKAERRQALGEALRGMIGFATEAGIPRRSLVVDVDAVQFM